MKWLLMHFIPWFVLPLIIQYYAAELGEEMFPLIIIGFAVLIFIYYITQFAKKWLPLPLIALTLSTIVYYYFIM